MSLSQELLGSQPAQSESGLIEGIIPFIPIDEPNPEHLEPAMDFYEELAIAQGHSPGWLTRKRQAEHHCSSRVEPANSLTVASHESSAPAHFPMLSMGENQHPAPPLDSIPARRFTPLSTAHRLSALVPLITVEGSLYAYIGTHYKRLPTHEAYQLIAEKCRDDIEHVGEPSYTKRVYDMLFQLKEIACEKLESDPRYIPFKNGLFDLSTGVLRPHTSEIITTYCLQCSYLGGQRPMPAFYAFLNTVTNGDRILADRIMQAIGYIISPDLSGKCFVLLQGKPSSGKSMISRLIQCFFLPTEVSALSVHELSSHFSAGELAGKRLCVSSDMPSSPLDPIAASLLKQATGNDVISADIKYKDRIQFQCSAKFVLATNHPLRTKEPDDAFFDRIMVVPFSRSLPKSEQMSPDVLLNRLKGELDSIATNAVAAYIRLVSQNYEFSGSYEVNDPQVVQNCSATQVDSNLYALIMEFAASRFVGDPNAWVPIADAYALFSEQYGPPIPIGVFSGILPLCQRTVWWQKGTEASLRREKSCFWRIRHQVISQQRIPRRIN